MYDFVFCFSTVFLILEYLFRSDTLLYNIGGMLEGFFSFLLLWLFPFVVVLSAEHICRRTVVVRLNHVNC